MKEPFIPGKGRRALKPPPPTKPSLFQRWLQAMRIRPVMVGLWRFVGALGVLVGLGGGLVGLWLELRPNISIDVASSYDLAQPSAQRFTVTNDGNTSLENVGLACYITSWRDGPNTYWPPKGFLYLTEANGDPQVPILAPGNSATTQCELPWLLYLDPTPGTDNGVNVQLAVFYRWPFDFWNRSPKNPSPWLKAQKFSTNRAKSGALIWTNGSADLGFGDPGGPKNIVLWISFDKGLP